MLTCLTGFSIFGVKTFQKSWQFARTCTTSQSLRQQNDSFWKHFVGFHQDTRSLEWVLHISWMSSWFVISLMLHDLLHYDRFLSCAGFLNISFASVWRNAPQGTSNTPDCWIKTQLCLLVLSLRKSHQDLKWGLIFVFVFWKSQWNCTRQKRTSALHSVWVCETTGSRKCSWKKWG